MKYHVEKSTIINTNTDTVKKLVQDFNHWNSWSPWTIVDPECQQEITGQPGESGHKMTWNGEIIGSGVNTLVSNNDNRLDYDLEFLAPFKSQAKTSFLIEPVDQKTKLTWTLDSNMPFYLFFMTTIMKNWIGMDYDRGLRMLKEIAEKGQVNATTTNKGITGLKGFSYIGIQRTVPFEDMPKEMKKDFETLMQFVKREQGKSAKHWTTIYPKMSMKNMQMTYIAAASNEELKDVDLPPEYVTGTIKPGKALEIKHEGSYEFLGNAWSMGMMNMQAKRMKKSGFPFEYYWNNPQDTEPANLETSIYFPVKQKS